MALKPKVDVKLDKVPINVPVEVHQLVKEYAKFLGHDTTISYVYSEAARKAIQSDKEFQKSREADTPRPSGQGALSAKSHDPTTLAGGVGRPA